MACADGQTCTVIWDYSFCIPQDGLGDVGDSCVFDENCAPGLGCGGLTQSGDRVCAEWCDLENTDCSLGAPCTEHADVDATGPHGAAGLAVGVCESPAYVGENTTPAEIPDPLPDDTDPGIGISTIVVPTSVGPIRGMAVEVNISHTWVGDLGIVLLNQ